jgi:hypothetical protein
MIRDFIGSVFLVTLGMVTLFAQPDSTDSGQPFTSSVLIVKGSSWLENAVALILTDSLKARGYKVISAPVSKINRQDPRIYKTFVIFRAIKSNETIAPVRKFLKSVNDDKHTILICTVYGNRWQGAEAPVDAVAEATTKLQPLVVANRLLESFR